jgi:hypothetical protein
VIFGKSLFHNVGLRHLISSPLVVIFLSWCRFTKKGYKNEKERERYVIVG